MPRLGDPLSIGIITLVSCVIAPEASAQTIVAPPAPPALWTGPPPSTENLATRAKPRGAPWSWITAEDFPAATFRDREPGIIRALVIVDARGSAIDCLVTTSSGSAALDSHTCSLLRRRARFTPAVDKDGQPAPDSWPFSFQWTPPSD